MTSTAHVLRDRQRDITFTGDLIATASSEVVGKDRWSEMSIYTTDDGRYVVHGLGKSSVEGETDRDWVCICNTAEAVIKALTRTSDDVSYVPNLNLTLLERASMLDDAISDATRVQRV